MNQIKQIASFICGFLINQVYHLGTQSSFDLQYREKESTVQDMNMKYS